MCYVDRGILSNSNIHLPSLWLRNTFISAVITTVLDADVLKF